jgi:hypothetical protein
LVEQRLGTAVGRAVGDLHHVDAALGVEDARQQVRVAAVRGGDADVPGQALRFPFTQGRQVRTLQQRLCASRRTCGRRDPGGHQFASLQRHRRL